MAASLHLHQNPRLCNKRTQGNAHSKPSKQSQPNPNVRPKERGKERERGREREGDLEFGFEKGLPTGRPGGNGDRGHKPSENGHMKAASYSVDAGHLKPGP
ncbi:hypothetical protein GH714_027856 [Hevea brasiliensis]|uniref:Uncharacterized protein n=1 Tax=Hevea brasiliensis TaxID=3981 RepID=A0A6A6KUQ4_HEVBR|nr:hypothetical protein GH714_027856 [Hevea brasiliensis]